jgi:hypothetical protein
MGGCARIIGPVLAMAMTPWAFGQVEQRIIDAPAAAAYRVWPSTPPADCPFAKSESLVGIGFTADHAEYTTADTWYPSWASDGNLYSPWTDGTVNGVLSISIGEGATTGHAKIVGDDPLKLQVVDAAVERASALPYGGRYPCGSLVHNGVWYYGTYCLTEEKQKLPTGEPYNWGVLGPFVGFRISKDSSKTWIEAPHTPARPLFPEPATFGGKVRFGYPHFVDFGRNMEHSPDGKAYLVSNGAVDPDPKPRPANLSWITGDQINLARVTPTPETINDAGQYEFFAGHDAGGKPLWTKAFERMKPLIDWNNKCGCVTMTYNAPLKKYLLCVTDGWPTIHKFDTYILESDEITGPWKLVTYMASFGEQGYFVNIPSKFISSDGRTAWLCYSANFTSGTFGARLRSDPPGGRYGLCLQQLRLLAPGDKPPASPLASEENVAPQAMVTVSSVHSGPYTAEAAVDGVVEGYPAGERHEWASAGEGDTATLRLTWEKEQTIERVWLFDRPNGFDHITSGMLIFSDGSSLPVGALPDGGKKGVEIKFPPKKVKWLIFAVTGAKVAGSNVGLAEIAVFRAL